MRLNTATALRHIDPAQDCPVISGHAKEPYKAAIKAANQFSLSCLEFLQGREPKQQASWLAAVVTSGRDLFQPWNMELLYTLAVIGRARFGQLQELLGVSSRTLSDKLQALRAAGLIDRQVFDEQPVRIEYFLTKHGSKTTALASPLLCYLGLELIAAKA